MDINKFFEGITKVVKRFAKEIAEQKFQEKEQKTGRDPKAELEKMKKGDEKKKGINPDFPKTG